MIAEAYAGLGAFKAMFDLAKGIKDINDATTRNSIAIELQEKIITAQAAQAALIQKVDELEKKIVSFETWETEKQRYELKTLARGFVAYVLKAPERQREAAHALCTNCYQRRFPSILQSNGKVTIHEHAFVCPSCKGVFACQSRDMEKLIANLG